MIKIYSTTNKLKPLILLSILIFSQHLVAGTTFIGHYYIESVHSNKALEVSNASKSAGANVAQWAYNGSLNQQWIFEHASGNEYFLKNVNSGLYLDVSGGSTSNGANIQQWHRNGLNPQKFKIIELGAGTYEILNVKSNKAIDVSNVSSDNGANIHQWDYVGGNNQKWRVIPVGAQRNLNGQYQVESVYSGKSLDVAGVSYDSGTNVHQWNYVGGTNQQWNFINTGNGYYKIQANHSNLMLDVSMAATGAGANIQQAQDNNNDAQLFAIIKDGNNQFYIRNKNSGKALDIANWSNQNGGNIIQWHYLAGDNQKWRLKPIGSTATNDTDISTGAVVSTGSVNNNSGSNHDITLAGRQLYVNNQPYLIKGICWSPTPKGAYNSDAHFSTMASADVQSMKNMGVNTIRTYGAITDTNVLDQFHNAGIKVINTVYVSSGQSTQDAINAVNATKNHPAILMWALGNEWNYNGLYGGLSFNESLNRINEVATAIKRIDTSHPITTVYGELPSVDTINSMPNIDIWGINSYRGITFGDLFSQWSNRSQKPMFIAEYGADSFNANINREDQQAQADATYALTLEILNNASNGNTLGGTIFEWSDEWWKAGNPNSHDTGGIAPGGGPYPDMTFNEEWWGLVTVDRQPKQAYYTLQNLYLNH